MDPDHAMALGSALFLPVILIAALAILDRLRLHTTRAAAVATALDRAPRAIRIAALLLLVSAAVHGSLAPQHLREEPVTGVLFLVDAVALTAAAPLLFWRARARAFIAALLAAGLGAYALYLAGGWEQPDAVGVVTKLVEVSALLLILTRRRTASSPDPDTPSQSYAAVSTAT